MGPSDVVGNIRFSHPTLYVFPGGQGDSALFGINGFNMLIDGGFSRKACFWDFTRHLDRLDAILVTRMSDENTQGINAVLERKTVNPVYPQIGHLFANILEPKKDREREKMEDEERDKLLVNVVHEGNTMMENLRILNLKPQICFRDNICDPINLYHKVGHGKLDMYVLNPSKESREVKEFLSRWSEDIGQLGNMKAGINVDGKELWLPIANLVSICALLVWQPANPNDTITRLLFPGSTPQNKIFKGLEKLRKLECLKQPTCSPSSLKEAKSGRHSSKDKRRAQKAEARTGQPDNTLLERKEKLARRKEAKLRKEREEKEKQERDKKEEREKRDREKEENEKFEKEKKERLEKLERKKKAERERKEKERKEKEEKDRDERRRKEREEREEKQKQTVKKEIPSDDVKDNDKPKKKLVAIKSKPKDAALPKTRKPEVKAESNDAAAVKARKAMPSKPLVHKSSTPPPSKLKKDESNKKVMETRKAAAARTQRKQPDNEEKNRLNKVGRPAMRKAKEKNASGEERKMDEKSVVEKVSKAIASGEIDDSRVIKDDEDDRESIVEKDQIEEMETSPINHHDKDFVKVGEDDEDAELQRIKDEEEEEDNQDRVPDIAPSETRKRLMSLLQKSWILRRLPQRWLTAM